MDPYQNDSRGDGGEMPTSSTTIMPPMTMGVAASTPSGFVLPRLPLAELAEKQRVQFPFTQGNLNVHNQQQQQMYFGHPTTAPANFVQPNLAPPPPPAAAPQTATTPMDSSYVLPSPHMMAVGTMGPPPTAASSALSPTPRNKNELLSAARDKLKAVRGEERDISSLYLTAVEGRDGAKKALLDGIPSLAERLERVRASVVAINNAVGASASSSNNNAAAISTTTNASAAFYAAIAAKSPHMAQLLAALDAPPDDVVRAALEQQLTHLRQAIGRLEGEKAELAALEASTLAPLEADVKAAEERFQKWQRIHNRREGEIGVARAQIHAKLQSIKAVEDWMREWVFDTALLAMPSAANSPLRGTAAGGASNVGASSLLPATLAEALGVSRNQKNVASPSGASAVSASSSPAHARRDEVLGAIAMLEEQLKPLRAYAAQHEEALREAEIEQELASNKQLLMSYRVRINALEKEKRKRPRRADVGQRLLLAKEQATHLRTEYYKQQEEIALLENRQLPSSAAPSTSSSHFNIHGNGNNGRFGGVAAADGGDDDVITSPIGHSASDLDSTFGGVLSGEEEEDGGDDEGDRRQRRATQQDVMSPIQMVSRNHTPSTNHATMQRNGPTIQHDKSRRHSSVANANSNSGGSSAPPPPLSTNGGNRLQARCRELQYALSTYRDVTLPDLRREHGELKGAVFDASVLVPEAWESEERRHLLHIAAMEAERDAIKKSIAEMDQEIHTIQALVQAKAAALSSKAKKVNTLTGRMTGALMSTAASGFGGLFGRGNNNKNTSSGDTGANGAHPAATARAAFDDLPSVLRLNSPPPPPAVQQSPSAVDNAAAFPTPARAIDYAGQGATPDHIGGGAAASLTPSRPILETAAPSPAANTHHHSNDVVAASPSPSSARPVSSALPRQHVPLIVVRDRINGVEVKVPGDEDAIFAANGQTNHDTSCVSHYTINTNTSAMSAAGAMSHVQFYDISAENAAANMSLLLDATQCYSHERSRRRAASSSGSTAQQNGTGAATTADNAVVDADVSTYSVSAPYSAAASASSFRHFIVAEAPRPLALQKAPLQVFTLAAPPPLKHLPSGHGGGGTAKNKKAPTTTVAADNATSNSQTTAQTVGSPLPPVGESPQVAHAIGASATTTAAPNCGGEGSEGVVSAVTCIGGDGSVDSVGVPSTVAATVVPSASSPLQSPGRTPTTPPSDNKVSGSIISGGGGVVGGGFLSKMVALPISAVALPYAAARYSIKRFIAPPSASSKTREELRNAVAQRAAMAQHQQQHHHHLQQNNNTALLLGDVRDKSVGVANRDDAADENAEEEVDHQLLVRVAAATENTKHIVHI